MRGASLVAQKVKRLPAMQETQVQCLGWEDPLEEEMATHSNTLVWKILWTEELAGYSPWSRKESDTTEHALTHTLLSLWQKNRMSGKYTYWTPF